MDINSQINYTVQNGRTTAGPSWLYTSRNLTRQVTVDDTRLAEYETSHHLPKYKIVLIQRIPQLNPREGSLSHKKWLRNKWANHFRVRLPLSDNNSQKSTRVRVKACYTSLKERYRSRAPLSVSKITLFKGCRSDLGLKYSSIQTKQLCQWIGNKSSSIFGTLRPIDPRTSIPLFQLKKHNKSHLLFATVGNPMETRAKPCG